MTLRRYLQLDVFADRPGAGNPLAVVLDADGLSNDAMQAIGLTVALTSIVFGPAPLLVGAPPALWGAVTWLYRAIAEFRAVARTD